MWEHTNKTKGLKSASFHDTVYISFYEMENLLFPKAVMDLQQLLQGFQVLSASYLTDENK